MGQRPPHAEEVGHEAEVRDAVEREVREAREEEGEGTERHRRGDREMSLGGDARDALGDEACGEDVGEEIQGAIRPGGRGVERASLRMRGVRDLATGDALSLH